MRRHVILYTLLLAQCGHAAFAGGDENTAPMPIRRTPIELPVLAVPVLAPPPIIVDTPVVLIETPPVQPCQRDIAVLIGRDDLMRYGCGLTVHFGSTGENPAQDDTSPN